MGQELTIQLLHGFLGLPSDWADWGKQLSEQGYKTVTPCLWDFAQRQDASFETFCCEYAQRYLQSPAVLFGYSMGGRLALEIAKRYPTMIQALVLASTNLVVPQTVEDRQNWEALWSRRFNEDSWDVLCRDWEAQEVFSATKVLPRSEVDFDRRVLARALHAWSITKQVWEEGNFPKVPTLWMIGADDLRMKQSMRYLQKVSSSSMQFEQPRAGHRFIFEMAEQTIRKTTDFLRSI